MKDGKTYEEIIGFLIKGTIWTGGKAIKMVLNLSDYDEIITRKRIQFMVACDSGKKWEQLLQQPTLFYVDEKGYPLWSLPSH